MRIVFAYKEGESIGIEYLSAILKSHGHETLLIYESHLFESEYFSIPLLSGSADRPAKVAKRILSEKPDIVAFSVVTDYFQWACAVAQEVKNISDVPVVFGGIHATALPQRVIQKPFVDFVVVGEGEYAFLDLVNALESKGDTTSIPNVWCKSNGNIVGNAPRPPIENLDSLPFPDKSVFTDKVPIFGETYYILTSRGCPYACTYCCNNLFHKMYKGRSFIRSRSPENVIDELQTEMRRQPFKMVYFLDDNFVSNRVWLKNFLDLYKKKINVIFRCNGSPRYVDDEVARMLADAGCKRIQMGVQSWSEDLRRRICHRQETNEQILSACKSVKEAGIRLDLDHILGLPLHEQGDYEEALCQYMKVKPDQVNCFWLRYYPGTEIIEIARDHNLLNDKDVELIEEGLGRPFLQGGSVKNGENLIEIQKLLKLIPFLEPRAIRAIKEHNLSKWLPKSFFLLILVPRIIQGLSQKDMWYILKRRAMEFPPFRK